MNDRLQPWIVTILAGPWPATFSVLPNAILQSQDRLMLLVSGPDDSYRLKIYVVCWCLLTLKQAPLRFVWIPLNSSALGSNWRRKDIQLIYQGDAFFQRKGVKTRLNKRNCLSLTGDSQHLTAVHFYAVENMSHHEPGRTRHLCQFQFQSTFIHFQSKVFHLASDLQDLQLIPLADGQVEHSSYNSASSMFHHVPMFVKRPLNSCKASSCRQPVNQLNNSEALNYLWSYRLNQCPIVFYKLHIITPIQKHRIIHIHQIQSDTQWTESSL